MTTPTIPKSGRYPGAVAYPTPNRWAGNRGRRAVVVHIAEGGYMSSIEWMRKVGTSSHFVISLRGTVAQLVSLDDSAWCNGLGWQQPPGRWVCPHNHEVVPTWGLLKDGDDNPNWTTISVELEGKSGSVVPAAQLYALERLLEYLAVRHPNLGPYHVGTTLIGHYHIDPVDKARCPGTGISLDKLALSVNRRLALPSPEAWIQVYAQRGVELPRDQIGWAIPQLYKFHAESLGACLAPERYVLDDEVSVAVFEGGLIYYLRRAERAYLSLFVTRITSGGL